MTENVKMTTASGAETPITDAATWWQEDEFLAGSKRELVDAATCRSLERALSAAKAERVAVAERCAEIAAYSIGATPYGISYAIRAYAKTLAEVR